MCRFGVDISVVDFIVTPSKRSSTERSAQQDVARVLIWNCAVSGAAMLHAPFARPNGLKAQGTEQMPQRSRRQEANAGLAETAERKGS